MAASTEGAHRERAGDPRPVEGDTEVDITIEGSGVLWFLEAKLHSDLSASTTYDPSRNQLARKIDVLLERGADPPPTGYAVGAAPAAGPSLRSSAARPGPARSTATPSARRARIEIGRAHV